MHVEPAIARSQQEPILHSSINRTGMTRRIQRPVKLFLGLVLAVSIVLRQTMFDQATFYAMSPSDSALHRMPVDFLPDLVETGIAVTKICAD
jgi:hypothetical protein